MTENHLASMLPRTAQEMQQDLRVKRQATIYNKLRDRVYKEVTQNTG